MEVDTNFYSRQISTYGLDTMKQIASLNIFIYGMRGLGVEIAKNIILSGPEKVTIYDDSLCTYADLGSNCFLHETDVKARSCRSQGSLNGLKELNSKVTVNTYKGELSNNFDVLKNYNVIVISELISRNTAEELNHYCREHKIGFIYCACLGLSAFSFTDFGYDFVTRDTDGEECKQYLIRNITNQNPGIVYIDIQNNQKLELSHGDYVTFHEITGISELNDTPPRPIRILSNDSFSIEDTSKFSGYISGGVVEQVKIPKPMFFKSLKESFENIHNDEYNLFHDFSSTKIQINESKSCRNELLHLSFLSIHEFFNRYQRLPYINNDDDQNKVIDISKLIYSIAYDKKRDWAQNLTNIEEYVIKNITKWSRVNIAPVCSFMGGIIAQEIVKITSKYTPFSQWFWCDFFECLGSDTGINVDPTTYQFDKTNRYQDQIAVFGNDIQKKLANLSLLVVGTGALGNEFLKNFALMGVSISTKPHATLTVVDNDIIELSNLNRQFMFRKEDIGKSKSSRSKEVVKIINKSINCVNLETKVDESSEELLDDAFWSTQDVIFSAVDNIETRKYIDKRCTWLHKILIDSGTLGTKAHSQVIIPNVTSCYNDTEDFISNLAICSLHSIPSLIEHCIEWAGELFYDYFTVEIKELNQLIFPDVDEDEDDEDEVTSNILDTLVKNLSQVEIKEKLKTLKMLLEIAITNNFEKCIDLAIFKFNDNFNFKIKQLIVSSLSDQKEKGNKFWTDSKRCPNAISLDLKNDLHLSFIYTYSVLISNALNIRADNFSIKQYIEKIEDDEDDDFSFVNLNSSRNFSNSSKNFDAEKEKDIRNIKDSILVLVENNKKKICKLNEIKFEKDDDTNHHVEFISAASNIRAHNYKIKETDFIKTKEIAGKITPALATTTASITGLSSLQLYSLIRDKNDYLNAIRNSFINLGLNLFISTEPFPKQIKINKLNQIVSKNLPSSWSVWDKIEVEGSKTVKEFVDYFQNCYNVNLHKITFVNNFMLNLKDYDVDM